MQTNQTLHKNLSIIFAMDQNRLIGKENKLPWRLPADMAYFKKTTMHHPIVMGRKTFESFGSKPLPKRKNIIITQNKDFKAEDCVVVHTIEGAINECNDEENFVIGGTEIYKLLLPYVNKLYVTEIDHDFGQGDTYFPEINESIWKQTSKVQGVTDEKNPYIYYFITYERKQ
ncbi:dihydrofolate reductase [Chengkuizengella axinellae]|uniref:Dihydrofolate reductase n=1 Tax=Chengkuizengella axinellae TaxID=3064388 RepID=A0ABT9IY80_9BACL|nr:dihydrofolate reductase [Chengkuizengella sp. 2205SS18-9]MDP5274309.1 dihydrofolate reductase [Chengkuizengella sp. 2205SS18-9]